MRNETAVGRTAVSVGSIAAGLADRSLGSLDGAAVLVIGAGQTAELVVTSLVARGAGSVARRQPHRRSRGRPGRPLRRHVR